MSFTKPPAPLATLKQVADYLNVSQETVKRRIKEGKLPASKIGGQIRIRWSDVDGLIAHGTVAPNA